MKNNIIKAAVLAMVALGACACTNKYLTDLNTDKTKSPTLDPNSQLTTCLLQTYGDFSMMDTYRCYITGFTQHFSGGWNVANYAGSVHADNDMMRAVWDNVYNVSIKNLQDAIYRTKDDTTKVNVNAALRVHKAYMMAVLTDIYGDVPCSEAGLSAIEGISNPRYDKQEDIYKWIFQELDACIKQFDPSKDVITGDVTSMGGDVRAWRRYANSLRMRYAMRVSDVDPELAQEEFHKSLAYADYITSPSQNAYVKYIDAPFTLYDGARDMDFRVNALGEMLYGQDSDSPTFICTTFYKHMLDTDDPRLDRICRHYINKKRSQVKADDTWNVDVTDEINLYEETEGALGEGKYYSCDVGSAWWHNWVSPPSDLATWAPTLQRLIEQYPEAGFDKANYPARMMRPFLSIQFEKADRPGVLMTSAEVNFLLAEALSKGWMAPGYDMASCYENGVRQAMETLNDYYSVSPAITDLEIEAFIAANPVGDTYDEQRKNINTQAWILHMMNPTEGWANLRRSDYPVLADRTNTDKYPLYKSDFTYDDDNLQTPVRLLYPNLEEKYNKAAYNEAVQRVVDECGVYDWHQRVWWDTADIHVE